MSYDYLCSKNVGRIALELLGENLGACGILYEAFHDHTYYAAPLYTDAFSTNNRTSDGL